MAAISAVIHELCREKVDNDSSCLYTSFRYVNDILPAIDNKRVRSMVADYIRKHENLHCEVLASGTDCKTIEEYCSKIEKHNLKGSEHEVEALAMLSCTVIRLISRTKTVKGEYVVNILNYGEHVQSFKKCVYILYDGENKHYDPLYMINKQNSNEKLTIFQCDDKTVPKLVEKFIREELHDDTFRQLDQHNLVYETERATEISLLNEIEQLTDIIVPTTVTNLSNKRKILDHANLSFANNTGKHLSSSVSNNNDVFDTPTKFAKRDTDEISLDDKCELITIGQHLQTDFFADIYTMAEQPIVLDKKHLEQKMKFKVEPALKFRGRTSGNFKPKKALNRKGGLSKVRPPRYFADRNNHHYFIILIPEKDLSPDAEHCLKICLVTREINGCTYINSYFKFQIHPTDQQILDENSLYILFNMRELENHSKGMKQLKIKLGVVKQKNNELMQSEQPLRLFSSLNNGSTITTKYDNPDAFKDAYHMHDLRFAVTLCKKQPGELEFHQCDDIQCISQISTEDEKYKVRN